jgi:hypothetical protein
MAFSGLNNQSHEKIWGYTSRNPLEKKILSELELTFLWYIDVRSGWHHPSKSIALQVRSSWTASKSTKFGTCNILVISGACKKKTSFSRIMSTWKVTHNSRSNTLL